MFAIRQTIKVFFIAAQTKGNFAEILRQFKLPHIGKRENKKNIRFRNIFHKGYTLKLLLTSLREKYSDCFV